MVYRYADDIFALGDELLDTINGRPSGSPLRFSVGVADVLPKLVAFRLLQPVLELPEKVQLVCYEGGAGRGCLRSWRCTSWIWLCLTVPSVPRPE